MVTFALVLGGGGPVGVAWYAGLAVGLAEGGVDLRDARLVVGTSAGAVAGAWLTSGAPLDRFVDAAASQVERPVDLEAADLDTLVAVFSRMADAETVDRALAREIGALALAADAPPWAVQRSRIAPALPPLTGWPERLRAVVVDAETGERLALGPASGVPVVDGVVASCTVAGVVRPAPVGGRELLDGGMWSGTNADLVAGADVDAVVVVAATDERAPLAGPAMARLLEHELTLLRDAGYAVTVVAPDEHDHAAFGGNLLDVAHVPAALDAGRRRGAASVGDLAALGGSSR